MLKAKPTPGDLAGQVQHWQQRVQELEAKDRTTDGGNWRELSLAKNSLNTARHRLSKMQRELGGDRNFEARNYRQQQYETSKTPATMLRDDQHAQQYFDNRRAHADHNSRLSTDQATRDQWDQLNGRFGRQ